MTYTIGEIAEQLQVTPSTIRYYDKEGLLPFVERTDGGLRRFREEDMDWFYIIDCLKKTGMPIKEIKRFVDYCVEGDSKINERLAIIKAQKALVEQEIHNMQARLATLDFKTWFYETAAAAGTTDIFETIKPENVPIAFHPFMERKWKAQSKNKTTANV